MAVVNKMMTNEVFTRTELDSALGRLQWATNCCPLNKTFLQAFWQWKTAVRDSRRPNKLLRGFARLLYSLFGKDYNHPSPYAPQSPWSAQVMLVPMTMDWPLPSLVVPLPGPGIGSPLGFQLQETQAEDSSFGNVWDLDPDTLPLSKKCPSSRAIVQLPLASDNQGNIYGLLYECTKKRPTAGFLREVMFQLTANTCTPLPTHVRRDFHPWADDLTHPSFNGFDGTLQLQVAPLLDDFKIFPWILQHRDAQGGCDGVCHSCPRSEAA